MRRTLLLVATVAILAATMDRQVLAGQGGDVRNGTVRATARTTAHAKWTTKWTTCLKSPASSLQPPASYLEGLRGTRLARAPSSVLVLISS